MEQYVGSAGDGRQTAMCWWRGERRAQETELLLNWRPVHPPTWRRRSLQVLPGWSPPLGFLRMGVLLTRRGLLSCTRACLPNVTARTVAFFFSLFFLLFPIGGSEVYSILLTLYSLGRPWHVISILIWKVSSLKNSITIIIIIIKLESQSMRRKYH